jgi:hypothetical protein
MCRVEAGVARDRDPLMSRLGGFQDEVTPDLMHLRALSSPEQDFGRVLAGNISRILHATDRISSRTR